MDRHKQEEGKPDYKPEDSGSAQGEPNRVWQTVTDPTTGEVTVTNPEDDPWDSDHLLELPNGARPVTPGQDLLETYVAMVIEERCKDRDFSDKEALDRCMEDVRTSITCVLGWIKASASAPAGPERRKKPPAHDGACCRVIPVRDAGPEVQPVPDGEPGHQPGGASRIPQLPGIPRNGRYHPTNSRADGKHNYCKTWSAVREIAARLNSEDPPEVGQPAGCWRHLG